MGFTFPDLLTPLAKFAGRVEQIVVKICDHPEHLQRLAIITAGIFAYPLVWGLVFIVWKGFDSKLHGAAQLEILGNALMGSMVLWGLVVVALLGIVRGVKAKLPGGAEFEVDIDNVNHEEALVDPLAVDSAKLTVGEEPNVGPTGSSNPTS